MKKRGFTILELTVVIVIISILASLALAQYQKLIKRSRKSLVMVLAKEASKALMLYYQATGQYYPTGFSGNIATSGSFDIDSDGVNDVTISYRAVYGNGRYYYIDYPARSNYIRVMNYNGSSSREVLKYYYLNNTWFINENAL